MMEECEVLIKNTVLKKFTLSSLVTTALVIGIGWFSGAKLVMHGAFIAVAATALLPFLILAVILFLPTMIMLSCGLIGMFMAIEGVGLEMGADAAWASRGVVPWYYRFMANQKHPFFWGVPCGLVIGAGILAMLIAIWIVPGETRTVEILAETQAVIERVYKDKGAYPQPDEDGHLTRAALGLEEDDSADGVVLDGFGRPLRYEVEGRWKLATYRLKSDGYNGRPGQDDFCLAGSTKLGKLADASVSLLKLLRGEESGKLASLQVKLQGIQSMRCDD